jgi:hypothetical protein
MECIRQHHKQQTNSAALNRWRHLSSLLKVSAFRESVHAFIQENKTAILNRWRSFSTQTHLRKQREGLLLARACMGPCAKILVNRGSDLQCRAQAADPSALLERAIAFDLRLDCFGTRENTNSLSALQNMKYDREEGVETVSQCIADQIESAFFDGSSSKSAIANHGPRYGKFNGALNVIVFPLNIRALMACGGRGNPKTARRTVRVQNQREKSIVAGAAATVIGGLPFEDGSINAPGGQIRPLVRFRALGFR